MSVLLLIDGWVRLIEVSWIITFSFPFLEVSWTAGSAIIGTVCCMIGSVLMTAPLQQQQAKHEQIILTTASGAS